MTSSYFKTRLHEGLALRFKDLDYVNVVYYAGGWGGVPRLIQAQVGRSTDDLILESGGQIQEFTRDYFIFTDHLADIPREGDIILDQNYQKLYNRVSPHGGSDTHFRYTNETNRRMRVHTNVQQHVFPDLTDDVPVWLTAELAALTDEQVKALNDIVSPPGRIAAIRGLR